VTYFLTPEAEAEVDEAVRFYATNVSAVVAGNFLRQFEEKAQFLVEFPGMGTPTTKGRRLFPIGRYPYSILYREHDGMVCISAVAHHARKPGYWDDRQS